MKTELAGKQLRKTSIGSGLYGRQWLVKDSLTMKFSEFENANRIFWPVYVH